MRLNAYSVKRILAAVLKCPRIDRAGALSTLTADAQKKLEKLIDEVWSDVAEERRDY